MRCFRVIKDVPGRLWPLTNVCKLGWWFKVVIVDHVSFLEFVLTERVTEEVCEYGRDDDNFSWLGRMFLILLIFVLDGIHELIKGCIL